MMILRLLFTYAFYDDDDNDECVVYAYFSYEEETLKKSKRILTGIVIINHLECSLSTFSWALSSRGRLPVFNYFSIVNPSMVPHCNQPAKRPTLHTDTHSNVMIMITIFLREIEREVVGHHKIIIMLFSPAQYSSDRLHEC